MFETSNDFLNIAIGISVLILAGFISWSVFYLAMILRQGFKIFKGFRSKLDQIDEAIKLFKEKIEHSTSYLLLIGEGVKKLVEVMKKRDDKKEEKK